MKIEQATSSIVADLWASVEPGMVQALCLEEAAQAPVTALHTRFDDSVVMGRVFVTVPYGDLPPEIAQFNPQWSKSLELLVSLLHVLPSVLSCRYSPSGSVIVPALSR